MGRITVDQSHQVMATLASNTDWDQIDFADARLQDMVIRNPKEAGRQFTAFLKNGARMITSAFPVLMTVELGTGPKTADGFRRAINKAGQNVSYKATHLLRQSVLKTTGKSFKVSIVAPTVAELGLTDEGRYSYVCQRGLDLGYDYCPPELGPQLRLQYPNQPKGETLWLATAVTRDSNGSSCTFVVKHNKDGLWLDVGYLTNCGFYHVFEPEDRIVFVCRK